MLLILLEIFLGLIFIVAFFAAIVGVMFDIVRWTFRFAYEACRVLIIVWLTIIAFACLSRIFAH